MEENVPSGDEPQDHEDQDIEKDWDDHSETYSGSGSEEDESEGRSAATSESEISVDDIQETSGAEFPGIIKAPTFIYEKESLAGLSSFMKKDITNPLTKYDGTGFTLLAACLRECLLTHRWQDAGQAVEMFCLYTTHKAEDYVWKCGIEVLYNCPDLDPALIEQFTRRLEGNYRHRKRKRLEKVFYLLSRGQFHDAEMAIKSARLGSRINVSKDEVESDKYWWMMIGTYSGMLRYRKWHHEYTHGELTDYSMENACAGLDNIPDKPGVWDIFVTKQVELLEADGRVDDAMELLWNNCTSCGDNPNAYRYLYRHLKKTSGDKQEMINILKEYIKRVPSDLLALDLVSLLQQTAKRKNPDYSSKICLITNTLFDMLDYPCWYKRLAPWRTLAKHLTKILKKRDRVAIDAAFVSWSTRDWWPSYHFSTKTVKKLLKMNRKVALQKAVVATVMHRPGSSFVRRVRKYFTKKNDKKSSKLLDEASKLAKVCAEFGLK